MSWGALAGLSLLVVACSGGGGGGSETPTTSGLPESSTVSKLSDADLNTLCEWASSYEGGAGASLGCSITVNSPSQCVASIRAVPSCAATVGEFESCAHVVKANPCTALGNPACSAVLACSTGG